MKYSLFLRFDRTSLSSVINTYNWGKNALALEKSRLENKLPQVQIDLATTNMAYQIATMYHQIKFLQNVIKIQ